MTIKGYCDEFKLEVLYIPILFSINVPFFESRHCPALPQKSTIKMTSTQKSAVNVVFGAMTIGKEGKLL